MTLLIVGVSLFILAHLIPVYATGLRQTVASRTGEMPYKGIFSLIIFGSLVLVYLGWTSSFPEPWYEPPLWGFHVAPLLVLIGFILFFSSRAPTNIKRIIRHPQLTGVAFWAVGHLLANGEGRSVILFGGFLIWSVIAILGSNRRDGDWVKPEKQTLAKDIVTVVIGVGLYVGFAFWAHEWLIGMRPFP